MQSTSPDADNVVPIRPARPAGERAEYPGADAFRGLVSTLQASARAATVTSQADPRRPGRTGYLIQGRTAEAVFDAVDTLMATVDPIRGGVPGSAQFVGPVRDAVSGWRALGEVIVEQGR